MEKFETANDFEKKKKTSASFIRHSKSTYKTYGDILSSENPNQPYDHENQSVPDLTEQGLELAKTEAEKLLAGLDPTKTILFFASSNEARAVETANVYRELAKQKGFEIIVPDNSRSSLSEKIGEGEIRVVDGLSINSKHIIIDNVFQTPSKRNAVNWEKVDPEIRKKFEEATKLIEANDQGNFGPNFAKHSVAIKAIFPEIETSEELYRKGFRNLVRLFKFAIKKAEDANLDKELKVLAFGHENYMVYMLEKIFKEEGINNCETFHIEKDGENTIGEYRGKRENI